MNDNLWTIAGSQNFGALKIETFVMNVQNGCMVTTVTYLGSNPIGSDTVRVDAVNFQDGEFKPLGLEDVLGDQMGDMMESLQGIMGSLGATQSGFGGLTSQLGRFKNRKNRK